MFKMISAFPKNDIITIHNQEIPAENELFKNKQGDLLRMYEKMDIDISFFEPSGKSSLQTFLPYLKDQRSMILVHNVSTSDADIEFAHSIFNIRYSALFFCLCPNANLYISDLMPDVNKFTRHNCNIVLGTDSLASNDQLSILEEIKTLHKHFPLLQLKDLLQWATINGAHALGIDKSFGSFEKGKKPGVILINTTNGNDLEHAAVGRII
jgi:cytosine/adenosine deaminase-related metal-dependent hydrolase